MDEKKYLDYAALQELVAQIKSGNTAVLNAAKAYVGTLPEGETNAVEYLQDVINGKIGTLTIGDQSYETVVAYVNAMISAVKALVDAETGNLTNLETGAKTDLVAAINEVKGLADTAKGVADANTTKIGVIPETVGNTPTTTVKAYVDAKVAQATGDASAVASDLASYKTTNDAKVSANASAIAAETSRATGAEEALGSRIDGVETKIGAVPEGSNVIAEIGKTETRAKEYTDGLIAGLGSVFNLKGTVASVSELPMENNKVGDVYHVTEASAEYVWMVKEEVGSWEDLGKVVDLSAYDTASVTEGKIATAKTEAIAAANEHSNGLNTAMNLRVEALETAIGEGGSVDTQISDAIAALDYNTAASGDYVASITETDGIIAPVYGTFNFDTAGAAAAVQGDTTATVASVEAKINALKPITAEEIKALFSK